MRKEWIFSPPFYFPYRMNYGFGKYGMKLNLIEKIFNMIQFLERIGIVRKETRNSFKMGPAVALMVLMAAFVGTTVYILISSLSG